MIDNTQFNYDIDRMKEQVSSPVVMLPKNLDEPDDILNWMLNQDYDLTGDTQ